MIVVAKLFREPITIQRKLYYCIKFWMLNEFVLLYTKSNELPTDREGRFLQSISRYGDVVETSALEW